MIKDKIKTIFLIVALLFLGQLPMLLQRTLGTSDFMGYAINTVYLLGYVSFVVYLTVKRNLFQFPKGQIKRIIVRILVSQVLIYVVSIIGSLLLMQQGQETTANQAVVEEALAAVPNWMIMMDVAILAPLYEELIFRQLIPKELFAKHQGIGFIVGGVLFCLAHMPTNIGSLILYGGMSFIITYNYYKTGRYEINTGIHMLNNTIGALAIVAGK